MKRKISLFLLLWPLICFIVLIVYIYISGVINQDKTFYIPQIEAYVRVYSPPFNEYGYVYLSKDSVFSMSDHVDFLKVQKSDIGDTYLLFNPVERNKFYIHDGRMIPSNNNPQINNFQFAFERISLNDTAFYEPEKTEHSCDRHNLKSPYFYIRIDGFLNKVFWGDHNSGYIELDPIK